MHELEASVAARVTERSTTVQHRPSCYFQEAAGGDTSRQPRAPLSIRTPPSRVERGGKRETRSNCGHCAI
eukprot:scaffold1790_cov257-Pinguiococcus_pyrenoidosus.AAC.4